MCTSRTLETSHRDLYIQTFEKANLTHMDTIYELSGLNIGLRASRANIWTLITILPNLLANLDLHHIAESHRGLANATPTMQPPVRFMYVVHRPEPSVTDGITCLAGRNTGIRHYCPQILILTRANISRWSSDRKPSCSTWQSDQHATSAA